MSTYKNGELLARWTEEGRRELLGHARRARSRAEACQSGRDGKPGEYVQSLLTIAAAYERAAQAFTQEGVPALLAVAEAARAVQDGLDQRDEDEAEWAAAGTRVSATDMHERRMRLARALAALPNPPATSAAMEPV